jgi:hypothetical protein
LKNQEFLPDQVSVGVAFGAMSHFLALHFNRVGGTSDVKEFIRSISTDEFGRPLSDEVFDRFKEAVVDADRLEQVDILVGRK